MLPKKVIHVNLGRTDYKETWDLQKNLLELRKSGVIGDIILTTEHNHVYTLGKAGEKEHLLLDDEGLRAQGISYYEIDRGGDLTYHGPGQIVVYPIIDLSDYYKDTHRYLRDLEETVILTLKDFGISAGRDEEFTGVWVGNGKICAIGIKISRWITMHGLAFNINTDLSYFDKIIPCGIFHKGVTSMQKLLGREINMEELTSNLLEKFKTVFRFDVIVESGSSVFSIRP